MKKSNYDRFLSTWSGSNLVKNHSLSEYGVWKVLGEDPNCDLGGTHYQPDLGTFEGKLQDVIEYAVELPGFWQWGSGGTITLTSAPKKINPDANKRRKELEAQLRDAEALVESIAAKLKEL